MTQASTDHPSRTALPSGPVWRAGLLAAVAATVANAVVWVVVQQLLDAGLRIPTQPGSTELQSLPVAAVIFITLLSGAAGAAVLWLLSRRGPAGVRLWAVLAIAFGLLSAIPAFSVDVTLGRQLGLVLFHLVAAAVMIAVVRQQLGSRAQ